METENQYPGGRLYRTVLRIAALIMAGFFLYWQIGPFLNWFGNR